MSDLLTTLWSTRYALSRGVYTFEVNGPAPSMGSRVRAVDKPWDASFEVGRDCFLTVEEANLCARQQRDKKIKQLTRQIARLQKLQFADPA